MEKIKVTFLGTSDAIPSKKRSHTAILVSFANENILVDCGEGTQRQFKFAGLSPMKLTRILITHWHGDHMLGLPGLFETLALQDFKGEIKIYGPKGTQRYISLIQELISDYRINLEVHEVSNGIFINEKDFFVEAAPMHHANATNAYSICLKDKMRFDKKKLKKLNLIKSPLMKELAKGKDVVHNGKKIKAKNLVYTERGKKLAIILDTSYNEGAVNLASGADLLISESSFSKEESAKAQEYKHLTAPQAAEIAKKANAKKLLLTHISQRYEHKPEIIEKEAKKVFKNVKIAKDFDSFVI
ncbi:MAG: ribonuclease Z [Candidatus Pacearchaeota archaeon]